MKDVFGATARFNEEVCGLELPGSPQMIDTERLVWFNRAVREELGELIEASTVEGQADAIVDLIYFAAGRLYEMGVDGGLAFDLVHEANMRKHRGQLAKRPGSRGHDAIKPIGWQKPDIAHLTWRRPKVLVLGHARHGKDSVCELLKRRHMFRFRETSLLAAEHIMMPSFESAGRPYPDARACYEDRHTGDNRARWYNVIKAYNTPDATRFARKVLRDYDVYCGMRAEAEANACIGLGLFDHVVWVDRSRHEPPEDESSCTVTRDMADRVIDNNGSILDLAYNVEQFVKEAVSP